MAITLTDAAAERVRTHLQSRGRGEGLRLGIKTTGCSGLAYVVDYADEVGAPTTSIPAAVSKSLWTTAAWPTWMGRKLTLLPMGFLLRFISTTPTWSMNAAAAKVSL